MTIVIPHMYHASGTLQSQARSATHRRFLGLCVWMSLAKVEKIWGSSKKTPRLKKITNSSTTLNAYFDKNQIIKIIVLVSSITL